MRKTSFITLVCTFILFFSGMLMAGGEDTNTPDSQLKETVLADPDSITAGKKKFSALCAYCHGSEGSGGKARKLQGSDLELEYVFETITNGKKRGSFNMPPWRNLPEETRWQLTAYIMSLSKMGK